MNLMKYKCCEKTISEYPGEGEGRSKNFRTKEYRSLLLLRKRSHKRLWNLSNLYAAFVMKMNFRRPGKGEVLEDLYSLHYWSCYCP